MRLFPSFKRNLLLASWIVLAGCTAGDPGPVTVPKFPSSGISHELADEVATRYSGARALETVAFLDQYVRWPGNRGFDASIHFVAQRLEEAGFVAAEKASPGAPLIYRVERYPMGRMAWEPVGARVRLVGASEPLLDFSSNRNMLARYSNSTPGDGVTADLVDLGAIEAVHCDSVEVRGKIVLADMNVSRLYSQAVGACGAAGVLGYSLPDYLQPAKNRESIQFGSIAYEEGGAGWGLSLSHRAQAELRAALAQGPARVTVQTDVVWTAGADELTVVAEARGATYPEERFVFSAHVQEPGANDNASGVGAQVEMARVLAAMVSDGSYRPDRSITFIWGDEIRSTARYIEQDSVRATGIRWGLSLDMVGEDTDKTGGTFLIEKMPDPSAVWTRGMDKHTEWGGRPLALEDMMPHYFNDFLLNRARETAQTTDWLVATNPYEGGSDHVPFLRADIPSVLFWHFTDQFYHTDRDRLEMVSAQELSNVGRTAIVSAMTLATADEATAHAIISEVANAALDRLDVEGRLGRAAVEEGEDADLQRQILTAWSDWYGAALESVRDLEPGADIPEDHLVKAVAAVELAHQQALAAVEKSAMAKNEQQ